MHVYLGHQYDHLYYYEDCCCNNYKQLIVMPLVCEVSSIAPQAIYEGWSNTKDVNYRLILINMIYVQHINSVTVYLI